MPFRSPKSWKSDHKGLPDEGGPAFHAAPHASAVFALLGHLAAARSNGGFGGSGWDKRPAEMGQKHH